MNHQKAGILVSIIIIFIIAGIFLSGYKSSGSMETHSNSNLLESTLHLDVPIVATTKTPVSSELLIKDNETWEKFNDYYPDALKQDSFAPIKEFPQTNNFYLQLPPNVTHEIDRIRLDNQSYFSRWEINETEQTVIVFLNCTEWLKGKKSDATVIDNWSVRVTLDPVIEETYLNVTENFIPQWSKTHPDQSVGYVDAHACTRTMYVTIVNLTPETAKLRVTVDGWHLIFVRTT